MVNASYSTDYVQDILRDAKGNLCSVVDEAHNFGAKRLQKCMLENFKYRLALSATLERHHDEEGTQSLYNYFKNVYILFMNSSAIITKKMLWNLCKQRLKNLVAKID